ncbi:MAG: MgtC/SapB family protein [bacterium]|nr:MAG: MgtC/SapB family protein [bacterium]
MDYLYTYLIRLLVALAIGGAIGLEREFKGKPAGIRTNMLMCIGSCLIMIISIEIARTNGGTADPGRIAAGVVTGVGFLGAGTIIRSRFHVTGLTTAATIWVLSALGLAIGAGYILLSVIGAALITVTLIPMDLIEAALTRRKATHIIQVLFEHREGMIGTILELFKKMEIISEALDVNRSGEQWSATFAYIAPQAKHHQIVDSLAGLEGIEGVKEL